MTKRPINEIESREYVPHDHVLLVGQVTATRPASHLNGQAKKEPEPAPKPAPEKKPRESYAENDEKVSRTESGVPLIGSIFDTSQKPPAITPEEEGGDHVAVGAVQLEGPAVAVGFATGYDAVATPAVEDIVLERDSLANVQALIRQECDALCELLHEKNKKYGNSALQPIRVFSRASPIQQIYTRIDDKISRLRTSGELPDEDTVQDLAGYLILLRVAQRLDLK